MAEHKVIHILVSLHVLLGKADQEFLLFAHVRLLLAIGTLQAAMLRPVQSQSHSPARVDGIQEALAGTVVEHSLQKLKLLVGIAQSVTMGKEEYLVVNLNGLRSVVYNHATLFFQVAISP